MTSSEWRFARFSLVGFMGAVLQLTLMFLLMRCFVALKIAATPVAVEVAILHNFVWHERFTWSDHGPKSSRRLALRFWRFHASNGLISLAGNTIFTYCLVERFNAPVLPTAMLAIVLCSVANFLIVDRWVYRRETTTSLSDGNPSKTAPIRVSPC
jgi:putative flippase GtrA